MAGKGDRKRADCIGPAEREIRWALFEGKITNKEFDEQYMKLKKQGKVTRNRRIKWIK
jgi:hypothetical protein